MIIEFSVGNYKSFKEIVIFSMVAAKISSKDKILDENNTFEISPQLSLLKSAAIYGANGSGKSNFIEAIRFMRSFVRNSSKGQIEDPVEVEEFRLSEDTAGNPSFFQMVFLLEGQRYRYGFEVDKKQVISEWLFYVPNKKETKLFIREGNNFSISNTFKEGKRVKEQTRPNALLLSVAAQFNGPFSKAILQWFWRLRVYYGGLRDTINYSYTASLFENPKYKDSIIQLLKKLDIEVHDVDTEINPLAVRFDTVSPPPEDAPEEYKKLVSRLFKSLQNLINQTTDGQRVRIKTTHPKYNKEGLQTSLETFDLHTHESAGTQKIFGLVGPLVDTLKYGKILLVDELDARLHPLITCTILNLFNSNETNPNNAQLIFTTHDTNLLNNKTFRRDQIWFTEKDKQQATHMYSLVEYHVRNDASFETNYIHGRYGAIPFIGDLRQVLGELDGEQPSIQEAS